MLIIRYTADIMCYNLLKPELHFRYRPLSIDIQTRTEERFRYRAAYVLTHIRAKCKVPPSIRFVACCVLTSCRQCNMSTTRFGYVWCDHFVMYKKRLRYFIIVVIIYVMKEKYSFAGHTHSILNVNSLCVCRFQF